MICAVLKYGEIPMDFYAKESIKKPASQNVNNQICSGSKNNPDFTYLCGLMFLSK